jgi:hypothetical protein
MARVKNIIAKKKDTPMNIRFPEGVLPMLDKAAKKSGRSRNTEIIVRLLSTFELQEDRKAA